MAPVGQLPSSARAYKTRVSVGYPSQSRIPTPKACGHRQSVHRGNDEEDPAAIEYREASEQRRRDQTAARQERRDRHTGTARKRGRHSDWYEGSVGVRVGGWAAADRSLAWVSASASPQAPSSLVPRPQPELPSFLPACSPALDLDAGPPPIGLAPTISAQPPSPQAFLLPPVVAAYIYIFPLTSSLPSASHINPRPPPHFCTHHPSCPPPPARGSKTPTRRRSSLPCLPTRRRKKRSKYGRHPLSNCVAPLYPVANCHRFHYAIAALAFDFYPSRR